MKRLLYFGLMFSLSLFLVGCSVLTPLQRSKFLTLNHLIDSAKYAEAKDMVEDMILDKEASKWPRTWYMRGHLAHTAYRDGITRNDRRRSELYPDQLYLAYESYEKALELDKTSRTERQLIPRYIQMANDFQRLGERQFNAGRFREALRAYEQAISITQKPFLAVQANQELLYNTAVAATKSNAWDKAIAYLSPLHESNFSVNATHLLKDAYLQVNQPDRAIEVLREGIEAHEENQVLVLLLAELQANQGNPRGAIRTLEQAIARDPENPVYHNSIGLIHLKNAAFNEAILAYFRAYELDPGNPVIHVHIATSYYNIGVQIEENARSLTSAREVQVERFKSDTAYDSALTWLDKAIELKPRDAELQERINQLMRNLRATSRHSTRD